MYFLQGDQFAVVFGNDAQAGGATVFGIGLFVEGESGFQKFLNNRLNSIVLKRDCPIHQFISLRFSTPPETAENNPAPLHYQVFPSSRVHRSGPTCFGPTFLLYRNH